jgi:hypothetical protein
MGFLSQHSTNIKRIIPFSIRRVEKGMIVRVTYTTLDHGTNKYMLLILNPKYKFPGEDSFKLHGLSLDHFPVNNLNNLSMHYGIKYIPNLQLFKKVDIPKMQQNMSSQRFYTHAIKNKITDKFDCYRTMFVTSFKKAEIVEYKFSDEVEKKYLKQEDRVENDKLRNISS